MKRSLWAATAATLLVLTGCAGQSTEFHRYTLPDNGTSSRPQQTATHTLSVAPIQLASFLAGSGVVYQVSDIEVRQAQGHLWADDLSHQLARQLRAELSRQLPDYRVLPAEAQDEVDMRVMVSLEEFQGRYDGQAVIAGQYQLRDNRDRLVATAPFRIEHPLGEDGYPALVKALASGWREAADTMAAGVQAHTAQASDMSAAAHRQEEEAKDNADANVNVNIVH